MIKNLMQPVEWLALNQQFFAAAIVAKNKFNSGEVKWKALMIPA